VLGDVGDPQAVRTVDPELAVDQVGRRLPGRVTHRATPTSAPVETLDAGLTHQPGHPLAVDRPPQPEGQLGVHARPAVGLARFGMNGPDVFDEQCIFLLPG
jgi:hypothetical protein